MFDHIKKVIEDTGRQFVLPTVSAVLPDGALIEMIYIAEERKTAFVRWKDSAWTIVPDCVLDPTTRLKPYSPFNNLVKNEIVLFPSSPEDYGTDEDLLQQIQSHIHRYVDVSPLFEEVASAYVLLTWIYDGFNELPYLRLRGDFGSGKTRFLLIVGSLCYKPIFASGASTVSPLFRILDAFRGTLIVDEADFRMSDEKAEFTKILNNGNARGFPVLRSDVSAHTKEINPRAYHVFGPKLVATRGSFEDRALESRFITEDMGRRALREDIPINLPAHARDEARGLRNRLLLYRFRHYGMRTLGQPTSRTFTPRFHQIFAPLFSVINNHRLQDELECLIRSYERALVNERAMDIEARILEAIASSLPHESVPRLKIKGLTQWVAERYADEYARPLTGKWIGSVIRKRLGLPTEKSHGVYWVICDDTAYLQRLYAKYGVEAPESVIDGPSVLKSQCPPEERNRV